ncbi:LysR substrate-binding domain-containing protein [Sphingomonas soli]|uniref:LysR substrate-binding domain-containing protein n=1 Tax=Sphingomonas soli TaxID=266127 RepID=UPI0008295F1D|nr:LysR substrate-binding domain-containing protein [Sphingomonas soli]
METRRLEYFIRIADAGSINRAAAALGIAQPALSQQLAILESELKLELFTRSHSGVSLTEAGRRLYPRAQILLRYFDALTTGDTEGQAISFVTVGLPPTLVMPVGMPLIERVLVEHPRIRIHLVESSATELASNLAAGLLDMAVIPSAPTGPDIIADPIIQEDIVIVTAANAPPPPTNPAELAAMPWFVTRDANILRGVLFTWLLQVEPKIMAEVNALPVVLALVAKGHGMALLPRSAVAAGVAEGLLAAWPTGTEPMRRTLNFSRRTDVPAGPSFTAVENLIRELVKETFGSIS